MNTRLINQSYKPTSPPFLIHIKTNKDMMDPTVQEISFSHMDLFFFLVVFSNKKNPKLNHWLKPGILGCSVMSVIWYLILIILLEVQIRSWLPIKQRCNTNLLTVKYKFDVTDDLLLGDAFRACATARRSLTEDAFKISLVALCSFSTKRSTLNETFSAPPHPKGKAATFGNAPGNVYKQH